MFGSKSLSMTGRKRETFCFQNVMSSFSRSLISQSMTSLDPCQKRHIFVMLFCPVLVFLSCFGNIARTIALKFNYN